MSCYSVHFRKVSLQMLIFTVELKPVLLANSISLQVLLLILL